jgi:hypothetical protein
MVPIFATEFVLSHNYYDYPGMSISKAPPTCSYFEELFKVLLKTVA